MKLLLSFICEVSSHVVRKMKKKKKKQEVTVSQLLLKALAVGSVI